MPNPNIVTSQVLRGNATPGGNNLAAEDDWLFAQDQEENSSDTIVVQTGWAWKLSAYVVGGFDEANDKWQFDLYSVIRPSEPRLKEVKNCSGCGPDYVRQDAPMSDQFSIPVVVNGKRVQLTESNNIVILTVPGTYRLIRDPDKQTGGQVVVHKLRIPWKSTHNMIAWGGL
ncbi:MAG: hypothetical protein [Caudoviricetes sp.]|nr:MAG: hypothetical protein [Caudoviricetes sp.]